MSSFTDRIYSWAYSLQILKDYIYIGQILQAIVDLSQLVLLNWDEKQRNGMKAVHGPL
jgi:hypothetical protein